MTEPVPADSYPRSDGEVTAFLDAVGVAGIVDLHVHFLPERLQRAVWAYFDRLEHPEWPVTYRLSEPERLERLRGLGVTAHTALAYPHQPGMLEWLNGHTLDLAARHDQVIPTFTVYPEQGVEAAVEAALARGGRVAKAHLQVGRFHADDPRLRGVWRRLASRRIPVVLHASAVYGVDGGEQWCGPDQVARLLELEPDLPIVVAHLGAPDVDGFLALAERAPTLHLDTAMAVIDPPYLWPLTDRQLDRVSALRRRIVFGSDFPTIPQPYADQVAGLAGLRLDGAGLQAVLAGNARRLLDATATTERVG